MEVQIDLLTVFIAALLNMFIGFFWYSKWLFGPLSLKRKEKTEKNSKTTVRFFYGFLISLVIAYFLALFQAYLEVTTVTDGMFVGFLFWLGFVVTIQISEVIWSQLSFQQFLINTGYRLLSFLVMSGVIGA